MIMMLMMKMIRGRKGGYDNKLSGKDEGYMEQEEEW